MHINPPADTSTTLTVSECPRCGAIAKSGKTSCCGRGGSWFKNCGGVGSTKFQHTWYEGIQACKARSQSKTVIGQQLNGAQQKEIDSSRGVGMENYKSLISTTNTFVFTSVNTSTSTSDTTSIATSTYTSVKVSITTSTHTLMETPTNTLMIFSTHTPSITSITAPHRCVNLLKTTVRINILFIIVFIF